MTADQDVFNQSNGIKPDDPSGFEQYAFVRVRARKVLGDVARKLPFVRSWGNVQVAATPSDYDHNIGSAEQVSWRYVASDGNVYDFGDACLIAIEAMLDLIPPAKMVAYRAKAAQLRPWPAGFPGTPPFEVGQ